MSQKNHREINVFRIQGNVFSDRATIVYQDDGLIPEPNEWDHRFLDLAGHMPQKWVARLPARFGEIGWNVDGHPVNWTTATYQERLNLLYLSGICGLLESRQQVGRTVRGMEIGGGSGEMGYFFSKALPGLTWFDCDLPECLIHNVVYLSILLPEKHHCIYTGDLELDGVLNRDLMLTDPVQASTVENAIVSVPNFLVHDLEPFLTLDVAFNTWSFSEMSAAQTVDYGEFLKHTLKREGVMLEQNGDLRALGGNYCKEHFEKIFSHRWPLPAAEFGEVCIKLTCGQTDVWANVDPRELLIRFSENVDRAAISADMGRQCPLPWAFNAAPHLKDLFAAMTSEAFALSEKKIAGIID